VTLKGDLHVAASYYSTLSWFCTGRRRRRSAKCKQLDDQFL